MNALHAVLLLCIGASTIGLHLRTTRSASNFVSFLGDSGVPMPSTKRLLSLAFEVGRLKNLTLAHGTFYFAPHSQEVEIVPNHEPSWNAVQRELLDDEIVDVERERERCARYNFKLADEANPRRRRLFMGALIGDDSMEVLRAVSTEAYDIYHTVSFIEGFQAHDLSHREMNYYDPTTPSENLNTLLQLFGPKTKVSVDYYNTTMTELVGQHGSLFMDFVGREGNTHRWAMNGMKEDDVGIIGDADEVFTRDFLRAMQICDIPEFRKGQSCIEAQVKASTLVYESSPNCLTRDRRWFHPDAILGECVDNVGNATLHPPTKRDYVDKHGLEMEGYGAGGSDFRPNYTLYHKDGLVPSNTYPLWHGTDIRMKFSGSTYGKNDGSATGYHFHNNFKSAEEIHVKYATYGHAKGELAFKMPMWALHPEDIGLAVDCANGKGDLYLDFNNSGGSALPIYYLNEDVRNKRHQHWKSIVKDEEEYWSKKIDAMQPLENENKDCWMVCGEKSGECPHFCGKNGVCCQVGAINSAPECVNRTLGCDGRECCVAASNVSNGSQ
ncbi:hypothetical protein ACHAW5_007118 [Stephanodiscus triporus]|uniref:Uncharacterized protein n=1 Tax=Stephanodiscus triporus TaxID=2934178 RepID=A0ABD3P1I7_9STRA